MPTPPATLTSLHERYVDSINAAVADGREDLARELAEGYVEDGLSMLVAGQDVA